MKAKKTISLVLCAVLLVTMSVAGTLAYLTAKDSATNTFTVGNVKIDLKETNTSPTTDDAGEKTDKGNAYKLIPGETHVKDPTVTVLEGSESCYVRMLVTVSDITSLKAAMPSDDPDFEDFYAGDLFLLQNLTADETGALTWNTNWEYYVPGYKEATVDGKLTATYEFRYNTAVTPESGIPALFTKITVPGAVTEDQLPYLQNMEISVVAHAIQSSGFESNMAGAWAAFDGQNS